MGIAWELEQLDVSVPDIKFVRKRNSATLSGKIFLEGMLRWNLFNHFWATWVIQFKHLQEKNVEH